MIRKLLAAIVGVIVAIITIRVVEMIGHLVYPPPTDFEFGEPEEVREFISTLPVGSILFVGAAWAAGTFLGTLAGALLSKSSPLPYAIVVGGIVLAGAITMLIIIPHPWWFTIAAPISIVAAAFLAMYLAPGLRPSTSAME
ncbi:MAG: hypothetical protein GWP60_11490 [Gammaproteobacteria bacterium]|jgi:hypothetical protein|nr:hypothetical protein [Gammaproteobacteria bacterium]